MSNPQAEKLGLENLARAQQMQINARLTALQAAQTLMGHVLYKEKPGNEVDVITLIAQATMLEEYILGNIVKETEDAIATSKLRLDPNRPKIVRP